MYHQRGFAIINMTIFYLTRTSIDNNSGGAYARKSQVELLKKRFVDQDIVVCDFKSLKFLSFINNTYFTKFLLVLQRLGIVEDYLDFACIFLFWHLKERVHRNDIVIATSGGELAMVKLAAKLKKQTCCTILAMLHDPISFCEIAGHSVSRRYHVPRDKLIPKYFNLHDAVFVSSNSYQSWLKSIPSITVDIGLCSLGFHRISQISARKFPVSKKFLEFGFFGNMGKYQSPEIFAKALELCENRENMRLHYIGDSSHFVERTRIRMNNVLFTGYLRGDDFLDYIDANIDVGLVSLSSRYLANCVPLKFYDCIGMGLPVIASIYEGDVASALSTFSLGLSSDFGDVLQLAKNMDEMYKSYVHFSSVALAQRFNFESINTQSAFLTFVDDHLSTHV